MNWEMVAGLVRHLLGFGGSYIVASGIADQSLVDGAIGGALAIGALLWSIFAKKRASA